MSLQSVVKNAQRESLVDPKKCFNSPTSHKIGIAETVIESTIKRWSDINISAPSLLICQKIS